jgi:hypothetical protein
MEPLGIRRGATGLFVPDGCFSVAPGDRSEEADSLWDPVIRLLK